MKLKWLHLDQQMTELDFARLDQDLTQMTNSEVSDHIEIFDYDRLEAMLGDRCSECAYQEVNGARAADMARAELDRRP